MLVCLYRDLIGGHQKRPASFSSQSPAHWTAKPLLMSLHGGNDSDGTAKTPWEMKCKTYSKSDVTYSLELQVPVKRQKGAGFSQMLRINVSIQITRSWNSVPMNVRND